MLIMQKRTWQTCGNTPGNSRLSPRDTELPASQQFNKTCIKYSCLCKLMVYQITQLSQFFAANAAILAGR